MPTSRPRRHALLIAPVLALIAGCGSMTAPSAAGASSSPVTVRLGYLTNLTHASALVGVQDHYFSSHLPKGDSLSTSTFNAGPAEVTALLSGALDAGYLGPNSAITAYSQSHDKGIRIISGATAGGAGLVVANGITSPSQLKGKTIATPQLGNTQDVALRTWLTKEHLTYPGPNGGSGEVTILPEDNATTLTSFKAGTIAGAWVPEPWVTEMVATGKGKVLVNEKSQWPGGRFSTTVLVVNSSFLAKEPGLVTDLLKGQIAANTYLNTSPAKAQAAANTALASLTGKKLNPAELASAWSDMTFTNDPIASSIAADVQHAKAVGFPSSSLKGIYDLGPLNTLLKADKMATVAS